jgi:O-antigen/teichoic acid export membrane protein
MDGNGRTNGFEIRGGQIARNTILNFAGMGLPLIVGLAAMPLTVRWLGTERFGLLSLIWIVFTYFSFFDLGLSMATTRVIADALGRGEAGKIPRYFWTTSILQAFLGLASGLALIAVAPALVERILNIPAAFRGEAKLAFLFLGASLPLILVTASFKGALEASQRFDIVNAVKVPSSILNYILPPLGALAGFGLPGIVLLLIAARVLTLVAWAGFCFRVYPGLRGSFGFFRDALKPVLGFGVWVMVANAVNPILVYLDRFLIGRLMTVEDVGYYTAPYEGVNRLSIVPYSLLLTIFPMFSALEAGRDEEKKSAYFRRSVKFLLIFMGGIVSVVIFFAHDILRLWLGPAFAGRSSTALQVLAAGFFCTAVANVPYSLIQGIGRSDVVAKLYLGELVLYVPLAWVLIERSGIAGAAAALALRAFFDMVLQLMLAFRLGRIRADRFLGNGMLKAIVFLGVLLAAAALLRPVGASLFLFALLVLLYPIAVWFAAFDARERAMIGEGIRSVRLRSLRTSRRT